MSGIKGANAGHVGTVPRWRPALKVYRVTMDILDDEDEAFVEKMVRGNLDPRENFMTRLMPMPDALENLTIERMGERRRKVDED